MKHSFVLFSFMLTAFFYACTPEKPSKTNSASFSCNINDTHWVPTTTIIDRRYGRIKIHAHNDFYMLAIEVPDQSKNTYTLNTLSSWASIIDRKNGNRGYTTKNEGGGNLIISHIKNNEFNQHMTGTFSFSAYNYDGEHFEVSNGNFKAIPFVE